jgi:hypothetical protein
VGTRVRKRLGPPRLVFLSECSQVRNTPYFISHLKRVRNSHKIEVIPGSSTVERSAVNRNVGSSNLPRGATQVLAHVLRDPHLQLLNRFHLGACAASDTLYYVWLPGMQLLAHAAEVRDGKLAENGGGLTDFDGYAFLRCRYAVRPDTNPSTTGRSLPRSPHKRSPSKAFLGSGVYHFFHAWCSTRRG